MFFECLETFYPENTPTFSEFYSGSRVIVLYHMEGTWEELLFEIDSTVCHHEAEPFYKCATHNQYHDFIYCNETWSKLDIHSNNAPWYENIFISGQNAHLQHSVLRHKTDSQLKKMNNVDSDGVLCSIFLFLHFHSVHIFEMPCPTKRKEMWKP